MKRARGILQEALQHADPLIAAEAARLIGEWEGRALVPELIENAESSRFYSKVTSIYALARLGAKEAVPHLEKLVEDPNVSNDFYWYGAKGVRAAAAVGLLQLGSDAGVAHLRELAEARENVFFRWFAPSLLRLKAPPELQAYLTLENLCSADRQRRYDDTAYSEPGMLCMLCEALALLPDPAADARLEFYLDHYSRFVRGQAYRSLYLRHPDAATAEKIGRHALKHGTDFDGLVAAEINRDSAILAELARKAPAAFDRGSAVDALGAISSPALVEAARAGLEDADAYVRQCAVEALGRNQGAVAQKYFAGLREREKEIRVQCALAATRLQEEELAC
jgi:HEAT repeat protein